MSQEVGPISPARLIQILEDLLTTPSGITILDKALPIAKGSIYNTVIAANTDFFTTDISPSNTPTLFLIYVCLSVAGIFSVQRKVGAVTVVENLNAGNPLIAGAGYGFEILVDAGEEINFRSTLAGTINKLSVVEKDWCE